MSKKNTLSSRIQLRIDEKKYRELQGQLQKSHYRSMSELIRDMVYDKKIRLVTYDKSLDMVMQELSFIRSELHAIGVNINPGYQVFQWQFRCFSKDLSCFEYCRTIQSSR